VQTALDFGCRPGSPKSAQPTDYNRISGAEAAIFEDENTFFRCRQRNPVAPANPAPKDIRGWG